MGLYDGVGRDHHEECWSTVNATYSQAERGNYDKRSLRLVVQQLHLRLQPLVFVGSLDLRVVRAHEDPVIQFHRSAPSCH